MILPKVFGKNPDREMLRQIMHSEHFHNGSFQNITETPMLAEGVSYRKILSDYFKKPSNVRPDRPLPYITNDLRSLFSESVSVIWFGHSSYLIHINGYNILVDPVFSGHASPFSGAVKCFEGTNHYTADDMPDIDLLIITHDHYDHLDYKTIISLKPKVKSVCTSLGVSSHLIYWGYNKTIITAFDWWDTQQFNETMVITAAPARHFSGRLFERGKTLWSSFIIEVAGFRLFIGGDSGYDTHFKTIGSRYKRFDLAILECGQYNAAWPHIHMMPEETVQASMDLHADLLLPVHWGKFVLANHSWNDPIERATSCAYKNGVPITTPKIGEIVKLGDKYPSEKWWLK